jgi:methylmalonyl-CoA mutase cobalamin-binding subunit
VTLTTQTLEDASARVSRYLSTLFLLNAMFGICIGVGLYLIGVPNALLWGIVAAALRFTPYIGPWLAAAMPIALSMAISTGWVATILTVGLFLALELFNNNFLEPWLYGKNTGVSAVAVLVAAVFWMWLWGPLGLLLATPLTVCILVIGKHVPELSFLDILLGNEPVFAPKQRIYQRLLAGDLEEAAELFDDFLAKKPVVEIYDTVLIPALAMAETHWQLGELTEARHTFIMQSLKEMITDCADRQPVVQDDVTAGAENIDGESGQSEETKPLIPILCLPARTEADEITALMLAQVLQAKGCLVQAVAVTSSASEMVELVEQRNPDVVLLSATPPAAVIHARYLCRKLRRQNPGVKLVVGLWNTADDLAKAHERIGCDAKVVATLADAHAAIRLMIEPQSSSPEKLALPDSGSRAS